MYLSFNWVYDYDFRILWRLDRVRFWVWFSLFSAGLQGERVEIYLPVRFSLVAPVFHLPSRRIEVAFRGEIGFRVQKFDYWKEIIYLGFTVIMVTRLCL